MAIYKRKDGDVHPYWRIGPFQMRLPFIHYRLEVSEVIQGFILVAIVLGAIPLLQEYLGMSYESAITVVMISQFILLAQTLLGVPFIPGWITAAMPLVLIFIGDFEPGPEAIQALVAVQLLVAFIFLILGITGLGNKLVTILPNSLKGGILIGAGVAAIIGEIEAGGNLFNTPISLIIGSFICLYVMYSISFKNLYKTSKIANLIANLGIMTAVIIAMVIGWATGEYSVPTIEWGIVVPNFAELWNYTPFVVGFPGLDVFVIAIPTAVIAYIIAYGDIVVGDTLVERGNEERKDEKIEFNMKNLYLITFIRNFIQGFIAPHPGLAGPIFTGGTASVVERYKFGRKAMESIHSGMNSLAIAFFLATFVLPLITLFQPVLPIALSLTLILTGYICISIGIEQLQTTTERGIAGVMAVVLAVHGAAYALVIGVILYLLIQRSHLFKRNDVEKETKTDEKKSAV